MAKDRDQVTQFWRNLEVELAEPILIYSTGRCYDLPGRDRGSLWGIFFLTPSALYFMHFAQVSWFSLLMNQAEQPGRQRLTLRVPRNCIIGIRHERNRNFLKRLLTADQSVAHVEYLDDEGHSRTIRFTLERDRGNFLNLLDTRNMFKR